MNRLRGRIAWAVALAFGAYLAYGIWAAGKSDIPAPGGNGGPLLFRNGTIHGERITTHGWSLSYRSMVSSPDERSLELSGIHDGIFYARGTPKVRFRADRATLDTVTNNFHASGHVHAETLGRAPRITFDTSEATYANELHLLTLPHVIFVTQGGKSTRVGSMVVNVKTGNAHLRDFSGSGRL